MVARTHMCRYPPEAASLPAVTHPAPPGNEVPPPEPHAALPINRDALRDAAPDLIVAGGHCPGCDPDTDDPVCSLPVDARVAVIHPTQLHQIAPAIIGLGEEIDAEAAAVRLTTQMDKKIGALAHLVKDQPRPRVAVIDCIDPVSAAGQWVPEMIAAAGGENVLGRAGSVAPEDLSAARPDVILLALRGFSLYEAQARLRQMAVSTPWRVLSRSARIIAIDAAAYFDRPGPLLVEGMGLVAWALHRRYPGGRPTPGKVAELIEAGWMDLAALPARERERR